MCPPLSESVPVARFGGSKRAAGISDGAVLDQPALLRHPSVSPPWTDFDALVFLQDRGLGSEEGDLTIICQPDGGVGTGEESKGGVR